MSSSNLSNEARKVSIKKSIVEACNALLQAEAQNEHAKEVIKHISEEYEMDKALVTKLVKAHHKQNIEEIKSKADEFIDEYESIFG